MRERGSLLVIIGLIVTGVVLFSGMAFALLRLRSEGESTSVSSRAAQPSVVLRVPVVPTADKSLLRNLLDGSSGSSASAALPTGAPITPIFIQPTLAAILSADKKTATVTFDGLNGVRRVTYSVTYPTSAGDKGANGSFDVTSSSSVTRDVVLGTCSTGGKCTYDTVTGSITVRAVFTPIFGIAIELVKTVAY